MWNKGGSLASVFGPVIKGFEKLMLGISSCQYICTFIFSWPTSCVYIIFLILISISPPRFFFFGKVWIKKIIRSSIYNYLIITSGFISTRHEWRTFRFCTVWSREQGFRSTAAYAKYQDQEIGSCYACRICIQQSRPSATCIAISQENQHFWLGPNICHPC
jgi:hypothetical protein